MNNQNESNPEREGLETHAHIDLFMESTKKSTIFIGDLKLIED